jgi:hypothetical protein
MLGFDSHYERGPNRSLNSMTKNMTPHHSTSMPEASPRNSGKRSVIWALALVGACLPAGAHPGHAWHEASTTHLLTSPNHLAALALAGMAIWSAGWFIQRRVPRRLFQFGGAFAIATAAVLWGFGV